MRTCNFYTLFVLGYDSCGCISVVLLVVVVVVVVVVLVVLVVLSSSLLLLLFCYCCYYPKCFVSLFVTENVIIEI